MTRIVAGTAGGRRLNVPAKGTRPTSERVREALFSSLEAEIDLDGVRVLDLYAGSGALGLEALSRGAGHALLVESDRRAAEVLRANVAAVGLKGAEVRNATVATTLGLAAPQAYDVVFADPPYAVDAAALHTALSALVANGWVTNGSLVLVERAARDGGVRWPEPLVELRTRKYGDTAVHWAEWP
ncbi:16S rRNA (guanine966-N2)-methyltransferase [Crossiella equi]|uniref:16S rRNA (Guanine966-N2)-methyltransferase n=1 Tax=Crossiella equi TaxID=130796 RepID=A0ABS5AKP9_9PSEU|nr:16S rRNA (guanine(966)-N(2))-methyltransferase RsmD [Crossiella equi]MBP2476991.1 16S rRNA (guanine966-N2)-methyltransferase [Crossiella equi]